MSPPAEASAGNNGKARVVEVWAHNEEAELARISGLLKEFPIVVMATSQDIPSRAVMPRPPRTLSLEADADGVYHVTSGLPFLYPMNYSCECLFARARAARFLRMSLALVDRDGRLALGRVWRFNLGVLRAEDERLLVELGIPEASVVRRIDRFRFAMGLARCSAVHRTNVTCVTYDGAEDIIHLLDCFLRPDRYPAHTDRGALIGNSRCHFPELYDLRFLAEWRTLDGEEPPLLAAAKSGGSLLRHFLALMRDPKFEERMVGYNGMLFGLGHWPTPTLDYCRLSLEEQERQFREDMAKMHGADYDVEDMVNHIH